MLIYCSLTSHGKSLNPSADTFCQQLKFPQMHLSKFLQVTRIIEEIIIHKVQTIQTFYI